MNRNDHVYLFPPSLDCGCVTALIEFLLKAKNFNQLLEHNFLLHSVNGNYNIFIAI